jgi:hypothetical protein
MGISVDRLSVFLVVLWLLTAGCSDRTPLEPGQAQLRFRVSTALEGTPDTLTVTLWMINPSSDTVTVTFADCQAVTPVWRRLYRPGEATLVWDSEVAYREAVCALGATGALIPPRDSFSLSAETPVSVILGDSIPPGPYDLTVTPKYLYPSSLEQVPGGRLVLLH